MTGSGKCYPHRWDHHLTHTRHVLGWATRLLLGLCRGVYGYNNDACDSDTLSTGSSPIWSLATCKHNLLVQQAADVCVHGLLSVPPLPQGRRGQGLQKTDDAFIGLLQDMQGACRATTTQFMSVIESAKKQEAGYRCHAVGGRQTPRHLLPTPLYHDRIHGLRKP